MKGAQEMRCYVKFTFGEGTIIMVRLGSDYILKIGKGIRLT